MLNCLSKAEIDEAASGLLEVYNRVYGAGMQQSVDIEKFAKEMLGLKICYDLFAEIGAGKIAFLSNGSAPLMVRHKGEIVSKVFPDNTIVLDCLLKGGDQYGRRRFAIAHESSHHILNMMAGKRHAAAYHTEFDNEYCYTAEEMKRILNAEEWQANAMSAALLMPPDLVKDNLRSLGLSTPLKCYGGILFSPNERYLVDRAAARMGVSYTAFCYRLKSLGLLTYCNTADYVTEELGLGRDVPAVYAD